MTAAGELCLWAAILIAAWGSVAGSSLLAAPGRAGASGFTESSRRALWAAALLLIVAVAGVVAMLLAPDPAYAFAASAVTTRMPALYRLAAIVSRVRGELLVLASLTAVLGALAMRGARNAVLCAAVLALAALPLIAGANPYARTSGAPGLGAMIVPSWEQPYPPFARLALLFVLAIAIVAASLSASRRAVRGWWIAAWGIGALALAISLRAALTGNAWDWFDWSLCALWLALGLWLFRGRATSRLSTRLAFAGALVLIAALAGSLMRAEHRVVLATGGRADLSDRFGSPWQLTSEGLSVFDELDRQAAMVLVSVRHGARTRLGRVELRQFISDDGVPVGREVPVSAYFPGALTSAVVSFAAPPGTGSASLLVRFVPLFTWWWAAAALFAASAAMMSREERAT